VLFNGVKRGCNVTIFGFWPSTTFSFGVISARAHNPILSHSQQKFAIEISALEIKYGKIKP